MDQVFEKKVDAEELIHEMRIPASAPSASQSHGDRTCIKRDRTLDEIIDDDNISSPVIGQLFFYFEDLEKKRKV